MSKVIPISKRRLTDGRVGIVFRLPLDEAQALQRAVERSGKRDRTAWMREDILKLPPLERATADPAAKKAKAKAKKQKQKAKKKAKKATPTA